MDNPFKKVCLQGYLFVLTVLYTIFVPLILIIFLPLYIVRILVELYWKLFKSPDFHGSMVSARNSVLTIDNIYEAEPKPSANLVVCFTFSGTVDLNQWKKHVMTKLVEKKKSTSGRLMYPQLGQYLKQSFGYCFWKRDDHFDISNHVKMYHSPIKIEQDEDIVSLHLQLIQKPFQKYKSPWEFILLHTCDNINEGEEGGQKTIIFFRLHHSLSDGFSILQMLMSDIAGQQISKNFDSKEQKTSTGSGRKIFSNFSKIFKIPYDQVKQRYYSKDDNPWHNSALTLQRKYHTAISPPIPVNLVKQIKNLHKGSGSTFTSIVLTAISAGIDQYFDNLVPNTSSSSSAQEEGHQDHQKPPKYLHTICPIPIPGRTPDKLGNYWSFCFVRLPIFGHRSSSSTVSRSERLRQVNKSLRKVSKSTVSWVNFALIPVVGALPSGLIRRLGKNVFSTVITSIFPGPPNSCYWNGHFVTDAWFAGGLLHGDQGICFTLISYNGNFRIVLMVDQAITSSKEIVTKLLDNIVQEINLLNSEDNFV